MDTLTTMNHLATYGLKFEASKNYHKDKMLSVLRQVYIHPEFNRQIK